MGSYNATCMLSGLPIQSGDKIKAVIVHSPYEKGSVLNKRAYCYPDGILTPAFFALDGEYDDYGGVEGIVHDKNYDVIQKFFEKKYKKIINDRMSKKEMDTFTVEDILSGIECGDLKVMCEGDKERKKLAEMAMEAYKDSPSSQEHWRELANEDISAQWRKADLSVVYILTDVWDKVIKLHNPEYYDRDDTDETGSTTYKYIGAKDYYKKKFNTIIEGKGNILEMFAPAYAGSGRLFATELYVKSFKKCKTPEEFVYYFQLWTESCLIESFMNASRKGWMIQSGAGSQCNEWEIHKQMAQITIDYCEQKTKDGY